MTLQQLLLLCGTPTLPPLAQGVTLGHVAATTRCHLPLATLARCGPTTMSLGLNTAVTVV